MLQLKKEHGALEIKGLGIKLTAKSTEAQIKSALKAAPHIAQFIDGVEPKKVKKNG